MPIIPCETRITCPGTDFPVSNFSSEAPDLFDFSAQIWTFWNPNQPLGPDFNGDTGDPTLYWAQGCNSICISQISQEDANLCARRFSIACTRSHQLDDTGDSPTLFPNAVAGCSAICPDGSIFTFVVPAGAFISTTQSLADQIARTYACQIANRTMVCISDIPGCCLNTPYSGVIRVTRGSSATLQIVSGSLPPGLSFTQVNGTTATITGTPTITGNFTFAVRATTAPGIFTQKTYTLAVIGITTGTVLTPATIGAAYSETLTAAGGTAPYTFILELGTLPAGLTLSTSGTISGTPTDSGDFQLLISVSDAGSGFCTKQFTLHVESVVCPVLLTNVALGGVFGSGGAAVFCATADPIHPNKVFVGRAFDEDFKVIDADTNTIYDTISLAGNEAGYRGMCYAPPQDTVYASCIDNTFTNSFIQIITAINNTLGGTITDADGILFGYNHLRYVSTKDRVYSIGDNAGGTDIVEINPNTNLITARWACTVGAEFSFDWTYCPDNDRVYVVNSQVGVTSFLRGYNAVTHALAVSTNLYPELPNAVFWVPSVSRLYIATKNAFTNAVKLQVYNVTTNLIETTIDLSTTFEADEMMEFWSNKGLLMVPNGARLYWIKTSDNTILCSTNPYVFKVFNTGFTSSQFYVAGLGSTNLSDYH